MTNYRYKFYNNKGREKYICPKCGKKELTRVIDTRRNNIMLPEYVGICDRAKKCAYLYTATQFLKDNPEYNKNGESLYSTMKGKLKLNEENILSQKELDDQKENLNRIFNESQRREGNDFYKFLLSKFTKDEVDFAFDEYKLGTSYDFNRCDNIYWYIDYEDNVRFGKRIQYDHITGKRVHDCKYSISRIPSEKQIPNFKYERCLFGEHLLAKYPSKKVILVEGEKTAVICSIYFPDIVWVSVGGNKNFNTSVTDFLEDRDFQVYPDSDAYDDWNMTYKVYDWGVGKLSRQQKIDLGIDFADLLLTKTKDEVKDLMKSCNTKENVYNENVVTFDKEQIIEKTNTTEQPTIEQPTIEQPTIIENNISDNASQTPKETYIRIPGEQYNYLYHIKNDI